jgi:transmembrane sensor
VDWYLHLNSADATVEDRVKFQNWRNENAEHEMAFSRVEKMWGKFDPVDTDAAKAGLKSALKTGTNLKEITRHAKTSILGLLLITLCYGSLQSTPALIWMADNKTSIGEQKIITLDDGSIINLNTDTAIDVDFSDKQRKVNLHRGEILVTVSKDKARPFIIATQHGTARALGTKYNVRLDSNSTQVAVVESSVETCNNPTIFGSNLLSFKDKTCATLNAGQATEFNKEDMGKINPIDPESIVGWSTGSLAIDNQPLPIVLKELQRYSQSTLKYSDSELHRLQVSGVIPLHDIHQSLDVLSSRLPIHVSDLPGNVISIEVK